MKKICALLIVITMFLGLIPASAKNETKITDAFNLISFLTDTVDEVYDGEITRGEFIVISESLLHDGIPTTSNKTIFSDVDTSDALLCGALSYAVSSGVIAEVELFRPNDAITYDEAFKILCSMLNYTFIAEQQGGFPHAYRALASSNGLTRNIESTVGNVKFEDAMLLFENFMTASIIDQSYSSSLSYYDSGENLLQRVYNATEISGIVTGNSVTMIGDVSRTTTDSKFRINGTEYESIKNFDEYIGMKVKAWVADRDGEMYVLAVRNYKTETLELSSFNCELVTPTEIYDEITDKTYRVDESTNVIYNGRFIADSFKTVMQTLKGDITLIENDDDSKYDVAIITEADYMCIKSVDSANEIIYDTRSQNRMLNLGIDDCKYEIYNYFTGQKLLFSDLTAESIVGVVKSKDGQLVKIYMYLTETAGKIDSKFSDGKLEIDGIKYNSSHYFEEFFGFCALPGTSGDFIVGLHGELVSVTAKTIGYALGYMVRAVKSDDLNEHLIFIIFNTDNVMKSYESSEKFFINGKRFKDVDVALANLQQTADSGQDTAQLVRYCLDEEGKLKKIDTYESATDFYDKSRLSNDDTLLKYDFADSYRYRYYGKLFYPYFNAAKTTFFIVPKDRTDYDNYKVTDVSYFVDGEYAVKPYNVSVDGSCEVAVYETNKLITDIKIDGDSSMLVVDKVVEVWDEEEDEVKRQLSGWAKGKFIEYTIDNSIEIVKASGNNELCRGDICAFTTFEDEITGLKVVFDADEDVFARNDIDGVPSFSQGWTAISFAAGKAYYAENGYIYLAQKKLDTGEYDFSLKNLTHLTANTTDVVIVDYDSRQLIPSSLSEIRGYVNAGHQADYVVLHYSWLYGYLLTIYRGADM